MYGQALRFALEPHAGSTVPYSVFVTPITLSAAPTASAAGSAPFGPAKQKAEAVLPGPVAADGAGDSKTVSDPRGQ